MFCLLVDRFVYNTAGLQWDPYNVLFLLRIFSGHACIGIVSLNKRRNIYQLAFFKPGNAPIAMSSRKQMRDILNWRYTLLARPVRTHRLLIFVRAL